MIEGQDVFTIEGELTGEPDNMEKLYIDESNYNTGATGTMMAKSLICSGFGKALVMAVGPNTVAGVITEKTQRPTEPTLLQEKLETIASKIGNVGILVAILTLVGQIIRLTLELSAVLPCGCGNLLTCQADDSCVPLTTSLQNPYIMKDGSEHANDYRFYTEILNTIIISITVIVVAIPEGLPLAVTISLSFSSAQMRKLNNLVRKLASSETMGGATHICSDKTGTLTLNKMTVMACMTLQKAHMAKKVDSTLVKDVRAATEEVMINEQSVWEFLKEGVMWNSSARIEKNDGKDKQITDEFLTKGNVTEQGLFKFFMGVMGGQGCITKKNSLTEENTISVIQFTSSRKRASIVIRNPDLAGTDREVRVYCKGAPDMLFDFTSSVICADGSTQYMDDQTNVPSELLFDDENPTTDTYRGLFERTVKKFADQAYRTLLITYKDMSMSEYENIKYANNDFAKESDKEVLENGLIAIGIFGLQDPLRDTIVSSIEKCKTAGIQVIMCTGDNIDTAIAISKNAGIVTKEQLEASKYTAMTGKDFREAVGGLIQLDHPTNKDKKIDAVKDMKTFRKIKENLRVLARSSPEDKYILVTGIQDCGGVVAVTGDGTNDAPALTKADVGFSMGITGTDVAKGASDIILLDDNFSSIVVALKYGRNVYDNVRKFLQFQLTVNVVAMFIVFFGSVILKDSPLTAVQMLWVNLIMDTFAALALATEPPQDDILERQPYKKDAAIVTEVMWRNVFGHAIYQALIIVVIIFAGQNVLCHPYDQLTLADGKINPYFTNQHYETQNLIDNWVTKAYTAEQFDQELLYSFKCDQYVRTHEEDVATWETANNMAFDCFIEQEEIKAVINAQPEFLPQQSEEGYATQKCLHFTFVFQAFVFMQVFNQINARKLELGEFNVFEGMLRNPLFIVITLFTFGIQMVMVEYGGAAVKAYPLNTRQNLICLVIGGMELIIGVVIKFIPLKMFQCISLDERPASEIQGTSIASVLKKSSVMVKK
jgi:Ca2+ transporting ATPase